MNRGIVVWLWITLLCAVFGLAAGIAWAQTTQPLEQYIYNAPSATQPYASSLRIPAAPNSSASALQYIPANQIGTVVVQSGSGSNSLTGPNALFVCTSTCTVTPPAPVAGYQFCALNGAGVATVITLGSPGGTIYYEKTDGSAYGTVGGTLTSGGANGDLACVTGLDATHYLTTTSHGTWTAS